MRIKKDAQQRNFRMKMILKIAIFVFGVTATQAAAQSYQVITDKVMFLASMNGKNLSNRLYGVNLAVASSGQIVGTGAGWDITGTWAWENGFFCREMSWGGDPVAYNCQLVEFNCLDMRFTSDQGLGDSASFRLR
jgi:hypothetical protein